MKKYLLAAAVQFSLWSGVVFAQQGGYTQGTQCVPGGLFDPFRCQSLQDIVGKVTNFLLVIGGPIAAIMVLWGGFQIMTAGGDPEKFKTGRMTILYAAIGLVVILAAQGVTGFVESVFQ